ncbi:hypothetical protein BLNAU_9245 [Blattamonas nauphoetae]|uniref:Uncharacterized protein n=1 Tax=Blattamonas nauphoetae TaxID=2049346 RepID=A0ABQ9XWP7_9EUKA|nr:hypothetical protein BLNAU_9245 [Blattamonas nauphoetae]
MIQKTTYSGTMCTVSGKTVHGTNIVKLIKDKYVFFDAQSAYVPSPLFSEARMLPEQLSKSCCLCASLENALDAVLAASAVRRWMAPENRSLGALDCLCCCRLVCCPFSTTERGVAVRRAGSAVSVFFRSMLSFFHSSLALFSLNMPSLVFPALHSLSRLNATARCCAWGSGNALGNAVADGLSTVLPLSELVEERVVEEGLRAMCIGAVSVCVGVGWRQTVGAVETAAHQLDLHGVHFAGESATDFAAHVLRSGPLCCPTRHTHPSSLTSETPHAAALLVDWIGTGCSRRMLFFRKEELQLFGLSLGRFSKHSAARASPDWAEDPALPSVAVGGDGRSGDGSEKRKGLAFPLIAVVPVDGCVLADVASEERRRATLRFSRCWTGPLRRLTSHPTAQDLSGGKCGLDCGVGEVVNDVVCGNEVGERELNELSKLKIRRCSALSSPSLPSTTRSLSRSA